MPLTVAEVNVSQVSPWEYQLLFIVLSVSPRGVTTLFQLDRRRTSTYIKSAAL